MEESICRMYAEGTSIRKLCTEFNAHHSVISKILNKYGIQKRRHYNQNIIEESKYLRMSNGLRFDVCVEWLKQFGDIHKLKTLNRMIKTRDRYNDIDTEWYKSFLSKFYHDDNFNKIYEKWLKTGVSYMKPSLDHITPISKGGTNEIENLQIITWLENRAKLDIPQEEWVEIKTNINDYFV